MDLNLAGNYAVNDYMEVQSIYDPHYECPITTSIFDNYQELLWTGNSDVRYFIYYFFFFIFSFNLLEGPSEFLLWYVSFQIHFVPSERRPQFGHQNALFSHEPLVRVDF